MRVLYFLESSFHRELKGRVHGMVEELSCEYCMLWNISSQTLAHMEDFSCLIVLLK